MYFHALLCFRGSSMSRVERCLFRTVGAVLLVVLALVSSEFAVAAGLVGGAALGPGEAVLLVGVIWCFIWFCERLFK